MKIFEVAGEGKLHGLTVMSLDAFVGKEDDVEESLNEDANFMPAGDYQGYPIEVRKTKFNDKYFIAQTTRPIGKDILKAAGATQDEALLKLKGSIDELVAKSQTHKKNVTTIGFGAPFAQGVLRKGDQKFYVKFADGKVLVSDTPEQGFRPVSKNSPQSISPSGSFKVDEIKAAGFDISTRYELVPTSNENEFEAKKHSLITSSNDKYVMPFPGMAIQHPDRGGVGESDISGIMHAAKNYNRSFLITAELAEGGKKTFRVRAQSERAAREKFAQHHNQARVISVKEEGVTEASKELPQWKKDWYAKQKPNSWPKHPQPYHDPDWVAKLSPEEREKLITGGLKEAPGDFVSFMNKAMTTRQDKKPLTYDPATVMSMSTMPGYKKAFKFGMEIIKKMDPDTKQEFANAPDDTLFSYMMNIAEKKGYAPAHFMSEDLDEVTGEFEEIFHDPDMEGWTWTDLLRDMIGMEPRALSKANVQAHKKEFSHAQQMAAKGPGPIDPSKLKAVTRSDTKQTEIWYPINPNYEAGGWVVVATGFQNKEQAEQKLTQMQQDPGVNKQIQAALDKKKNESVSSGLAEAPGDFGLGANYRAIPDDEMQDLMGRSKNKQKTKRDKFDYPYIHGSNIEVKDEAGQSFDTEKLKAAIMTRPERILGQNAKMQHSETGTEAIFDIGLPALKGLAVNEKTGEFVVVDTCPGAGACQTYCYAMKGSYVMFKAVSMGLARMLNFLLNDPAGFASKLNAEIASARSKYAKKGARIVVRWHDAGDFFSPEYLAMAYSVAEANPDVGFYAYTKMGDVANAARPKNFNMNFSQGAKTGQEKKVNITRTKHSKVVPKDMFFDLIARKGNELIKDAKGRMQFASPENLDKFKSTLAQKYAIDKDSILTYDQMMKTPVGAEPKWNVIVMPGDGDNSANRNDVVGSYLLFH